MTKRKCSKCGLTIYVKDDGVEIWTCVHSPNYKYPVSSRRNKLISVNDLKSGNHCSPFTLGHIFATGRIEFTVPPHAEDVFREIYFSIKNVELPEKSSVYFNNMNRHDKRWYSSKVVFDFYDGELDINSEYEIYYGESANKVVVSRNVFTWYLLNMGMDVNGKHDPEKALEVFDEDDKKEFLRGFAGI